MPIIDVDAERSERAAARETTGQDPNGIRVGGQVIALPDEFPLDVLTPLLEIDLDLTSVISVLRDSVDGDGTVSNDQVVGALADLLLMNPRLQQTLPAALGRCAEVLMGPEGYARWLAARPTISDYVTLGRNLFTIYGVSLGEASASSDSFGGAGTTSRQTSNGSTGSTPDSPEGGLAPAS